jgi:hypothetical protein
VDAAIVRAPFAEASHHVDAVARGISGHIEWPRDGDLKRVSPDRMAGQADPAEVDGQVEEARRVADSDVHGGSIGTPRPLP